MAGLKQRFQDRLAFSGLNILFTLTVFLCAFVFVPADAFANPRYASFVIDADTGMVLHERYADKRLHPASLTKVMTLLMLFDEMEAGRIHPNTRIRVSQNAAGMVPSKLDLPAGSTIRVKDAIYALVTKSANDIAVAIAEHLGGSERRFATQMTQKARAIGMRKTTFRNASGLHDRSQVTTARDMARMAQYVINRYPDYYKFFSTKNFRYRGKSYHNHNRLMSSYPGMDGMKTGYVNASGFNLIASAIRDNQRLIGVVFGGRTANSRNAHMKKLLDRAFKESREIRIAENVPLPTRKPALYAALASLNKIMPAPPKPEHEPKRGATEWAMLNTQFEGSIYSKIIGEGDFDPEEVKRLETGLMAAAAHTGRTDFFEKAPRTPSLKLASFVPAAAPTAKAVITAEPVKPSSKPGLWSIQIGAFTSRVETDQAIAKARGRLPQNYASASPLIVPARADDGWVFRGRLHGYSQDDAQAACSYLKDCVPVAP